MRVRRSGWTGARRLRRTRSGCSRRTGRATRRWRRWRPLGRVRRDRRARRRRTARGQWHDRLLRRVGQERPGRAGAMSETACERKIALSVRPGRSSTASPNASRRSCGRGRAAVDASVTRSSATPTAPRSTSSRRRSGQSAARSRDDRTKLRDYREAFCGGIREFNARGPSAGKWWTVQFLIRRCAWHMLDHRGNGGRDLSTALASPRAPRRLTGR